MIKNSISKNTDFSRSYPTLFIVSTPIGNLKDITLRAIEVLKGVDLIVSEDTRVTKKLLDFYQISKECKHFDDYSSDNEIKNIVNLIESGKNVALVSDAGTPLISDPGYKLVRHAIDKDIKIEALPGPCSIINALVLSGLKNTNFTFLGFLSHEPSEKKRQLEKARLLEEGTIIFFESPNRLLETLDTASKIFEDAKVCVAREMTKLFQQITAGTFSNVIEEYTSKDKIRGEIVVLIEFSSKKDKLEDESIRGIIQTLTAQGMSLKDSVAEVSSAYKLPKNKVYDIALSIKRVT